MPAAAAQAETVTLGPTDIDSGPGVSSATQYTFVNVENSKRFVLTAPADGLVTSWSVNMRIGGTVRLVALHPEADGSYTTGQQTQDQNAKPGHNDFSAPLPLQAGDAIGLKLGGKARVWARPEGDGLFRARDDGHKSVTFVDWPGYYVLFDAEFQYSEPPTVPPVPTLPPQPGGDFPPTLPDFGPPSSGGDGGGSAPRASSESPPTITGVSPASGSTAGGDRVVLTGDRFDSARAVYFGGVQAPSFTVDGFNQLTAITPAHAEGAVGVEVVNDGGLSSVTSGSVFSFVAPAQPAPAAPAPVTAHAPSKAKPRVRCVHAPTLIGRTVTGARKALRRAGCGTNLRIVLVGRRHGHRRVKVRSQVPAPRHVMRRDRRVTIRVR